MVQSTREEEKFYWHKKRQLDEQRGRTGEEQAVWEADRREYNRLELERIKRQREERDAAGEKKQAERDRIQLEKERESLGDWEEKERIFHLSQVYQKMYLRVREGRARSLHLLALHTLRLSLLLGNELLSEVLLLSDVTLSGLLVQLNATELEAVMDELTSLLLPYEKDRRMLDFWDAFRELCVYCARRDGRDGGDRNLAIVRTEVDAVFAGKSLDKLHELRHGIEEKLRLPNVDTDYWAGLLKRLDQLILRARVDELYVELRGRLLGDAESRSLPVHSFSFADYASGAVRFAHVSRHPVHATEQDQSDGPALELEPVSHISWDNSHGALALFEQEQARHVGKDELPFNTEAEDPQLRSAQPAWKARYARIKSRRPRYFNRVRMNYEWNKYNQTHYDSANPPPKIVQGFRFNVFYPDLLSPHESSSIPTYRTEKDPTSADNRIVRFSAGAPYEDVVFRIPAEEWDMSSKHGFKCVFDRGALRLHFWFRSQRYRR